MSEYSSVERPFLDQLKALGWTTIDHGKSGIPQDPTISLRQDFREWVLKEEFAKCIQNINKTSSGVEWLTSKQIDELYHMITKVNKPSLLETNKVVTELLTQTKPRVDKNEVTGEDNPAVKLIDFETPENNHFLAINQFRIDTIGTQKEYIIPDIVLFVNGIPLVVVECKVPNKTTSGAIQEGIGQLLRYQNRRISTEDKKEKEGEEGLFHCNQFLIVTDGDEARIGTISSEYEHFLEWKSIDPEKYKDFTSPINKVRSQETLIQGTLNKENLLKIIKHFTIFKPVNDKKEIKIVCRYQQFRAVQKMIDRLLKGETYGDRSGVVFHTQGSGKSLTMVFFIRQLRFMEDLKDYKIILINDRKDLEKQLGETAKLTNETVHYVNRSSELKKKLSGNSSDLTLVMMHKFGGQKREEKLVENLIEAGVLEEDLLPEIKEMGEVNDSERIIILIDEAHRTQNNGKGLGGNLFKAFPKATKMAFTGTPLITGKHKRKTIEIFGNHKDYIDEYRAKDSVRDGATLQIAYIGRKDKLKLAGEDEFNFEFQEEFKDKTKKELEEINKRYGKYRDFLESDDHIKTVSKDIVDHYVSEILINRFKAQVVCISQIATIKYKKAIDKAIQEKIKELEGTFVPDDKKTIEAPEGLIVSDDSLLKKLTFLKTAIAISGKDNESNDMTKFIKEAKSLDAVKNFKKEYDYKKPATGVGILIVCDRLLTGFDAPIEQVMYLDKIMREHTLFQAITRVNRTHANKSKGYVVDYAGVSSHILKSLQIYSGDHKDDDTFKAIADINEEKPVLRDRYNRLVNLFMNKGVTEITDYISYKIKDPNKQYEVLEKCIDVCEDLKARADFEVYYKRYLSSLDILINLDIDEKYTLAMNAFGHIQARMKNRFKDDTINLLGVGEKVKQLINKHVESQGISNKVPPLELFDIGFKENLKKHKSRKAKASEMEHAIRKAITLNKDTDPVLYDNFLEKLKKILEKNTKDMDARFKGMEKIYKEMKKGRSDKKKETPYYDLLINKIFKNESIEEYEDKLKDITRKIVDFISKEIKRKNFWNANTEIDKLKGDIGEMLLFSDIEKLEENEKFIASEFVNLAKNRS